MTGATGFIGSHLVEALDDAGETVRGADLPETDLRSAVLDRLLEDVDVVHHLAGRPGVRSSWGDGFDDHLSCNVTATQRLLEAARRSGIRRFVYASSSSVYGNADFYPVAETDPTAPHSPYGITKLAAEHLCTTYGRNHDLPTVSLRYFSVYGPRQRPDMAHHRMIESALDERPFPLYGDGSHVRDFTYVGDVVRAHLRAADPDVDLEAGTVMNICAGRSTVLRDLIELVGETLGSPVEIDKLDAQPGDVRRTGGSNELAAELLGWSPQTSLEEGIRAQVDWHRECRVREVALRTPKAT